MNNYKIYIHTNLDNGMKYIGQTKRDVQTRWKGWYNSFLTNAMKNHLFHSEVVADNLTKEEADNLEKLLIKKYNTLYPNGYNFTEGGDGSVNYKHSKETKIKMSKNHANVSGENNPMYNKKGINNPKSKKVYQYDKNLQLINTFDGVREAERLTGINHSSISGCCTGRLKTAGKFIWSYEILF